MTAHAMSGDRERCIEVGMDDYISKSLNPDEIFSLLGSIEKQGLNLVAYPCFVE
jgi:CheY-like chemotaxis protein